MDKELEKAIKRLKEGFGKKLLGVILFGSAARGEKKIPSDYDLFVIVDTFLPLSPFKRNKILLSKIKTKGKINFILHTKEEFEGAFPPLYLDIGLDGIVLYEKDDYATLKLNKIKQLIKEAGLIREKTPYGFNWRWIHSPKTYQWKIDWDGVDAVF